MLLISTLAVMFISISNGSLLFLVRCALPDGWPWTSFGSISLVYTLMPLLPVYDDVFTRSACSARNGSPGGPTWPDYWEQRSHPRYHDLICLSPPPVSKAVESGPLGEALLLSRRL